VSIRVLQLISSAGHYGAEEMVLTLARSLSSEGNETIVAAFDNVHRPNTALLEQARLRGLAVESVTCRGRVDPQTVGEIRKLIRRYDVDVLHMHGYKADVYGLLAASGRATVSTCHNWLTNQVAERAYASMDRFALRFCGIVVAVSQKVAAILKQSGIKSDRIRLISNGIDISSYQDALPSPQLPQRADGHCVVGVVGRLSPEKGIEYVLRAAVGVLAHAPKTLFVIVGSGPQAASLRELSKVLKIENSVFFAGNLGEMPRVYAAIDILVMPSLTEGMPMTLLEGLASSRPVVASSVGDIPSVVQDAKTGLLTQPKDVAGLTSAIIRLLIDPEMRSRLGKQGKALVEERFSARSMARQYADVYSELTN
jgi:glycosyltransferase involved in cell wall biosynthesis